MCNYLKPKWDQFSALCGAKKTELDELSVVCKIYVYVGCFVGAIFMLTDLTTYSEAIAGVVTRSSNWFDLGRVLLTTLPLSIIGGVLRSCFLFLTGACFWPFFTIVILCNVEAKFGKQPDIPTLPPFCA